VCRALDGLLPAPVSVEANQVISTIEPEVLSASDLL
jgi:hypothetical protein